MIFAWFGLVTSVLLIGHTYFIYPLILQFLKGIKSKSEPTSILPLSVGVLIAAFNEEKIIREKLLSVLNHVPENVELEVYVGSDASTDSTNDIISVMQKEYQNLHLIQFKGRTGKAEIINELAKNKNHDIFILTDANVIFQPKTIHHLLLPFCDQQIKITCANIQKRSNNASSFEQIEKAYLNRENNIKKAESEIWKIVIGAEGGCYAIRSTAFCPIPKNFFMDDFFMTMQVLEKNGKVVFCENAICHEDIPNKVSEETKRKIRISIGNFQNLNRFKRLLFPFWNHLSFAFWSHKVLRWLTPFFIFSSFLCSIIIATENQFMVYLSIIQFIFLLSPLFSFFQIKLRWLNLIVHFYTMNFALLVGFFKFLKGVESSIWTPPIRNISN